MTVHSGGPLLTTGPDAAVRAKVSAKEKNVLLSRKGISTKDSRSGFTSGYNRKPVLLSYRKPHQFGIAILIMPEGI